MIVVRLSKLTVVAAIALLSTLVAFGNITDYGTNFAFVRHVMMMDTIFPDATIAYRAIHSSWLHHAAYVLIIVVQSLVALFCWAGALGMWRQRAASARDFNGAKKWAIVGLTLGFVVWQVGFMSIGGEWFGMWMSSQWNGIQSAFRFFITIIAVLMYLSLPDGELHQ